MAVWTMYRSGNKSVLSGTASSPWYDGPGGTQTLLNSKPGNGDSIVKAGFNLTFDENTTFGSNTAATNALSGLGNVTISAGITLVVRGLIPANNYVTFTMGNNSILEFDASATTPTSTKYGMVMGYASNIVVGTGCEIRSNAGGGVGYLDINAASHMDLVGITFTRIGDLNQYAIRAQSITPDVADSRFVLTDCTFNTCGMRWLQAGILASRRCEVERNNEIANVGTTGSVYSLGYAYPFSYWNACPVTSGAGTRTFKNNVCRHASYFSVPSAWTSTRGNAFLGQAFTPNGIAGFPDFTNNLNVQNSTVYGGSGVPVMGNQTDCYHVADSTITDNWHALNLTIAGDTAYSGLIFDAVGIVNSTDLGELIDFASNPGSACVATVRRCIGLPSMSDQNGDTSYKAACGALVWATGSNITVSVEHCTHYSLFAKGVDAAILATGETVATRTGQVSSVQGNIAWSTKATSAHLARDRGYGGYVINDPVTVAGHNGIFNGSPSYSGTGGVGYYVLTSATTAGTGDVTTDPGFVDPWRNIATWAVTLGNAGTNSQLLTAACEYISADCSLIETRLAALMAYVRAGFRPTNAAYYGTSYTTDSATTDAGGNAYTGTYPDLGAMAYVSLGTVPYFANSMSGGFLTLGLA